MNLYHWRALEEPQQAISQNERPSAELPALKAFLAHKRVDIASAATKEFRSPLRAVGDDFSIQHGECSVRSAVEGVCLLG